MIENLIRQVVANCGKSQHQLAKDAGISQPSVHKFLKHGMSLCGDKLQRLAQACGCEIVVQRKLKARGRNRRIKQEATIA